MTNNDILRRVRYIFDFKDSKMVSILQLAGLEITRAEVCNWLKKEDDPDFTVCGDNQLAAFLNGLIVERRGVKQGPMPEPEPVLTRNLILKKLKIALELTAEDILEILALAGTRISKHELSAFFRKPGNRQYRACKDQVLRKFLKGLQQTYRPSVWPACGP